MGVKDLEDLKKLSMLRSQIDGISVEKIMTTEFPSVGSDSTIANALSVMRDTRYQDLPVVDNGTYVGVVSYYSILRKKSVTLDAKVKNLIRNIQTATANSSIVTVQMRIHNSDIVTFNK